MTVCFYFFCKRVCTTREANSFLLEENPASILHESISGRYRPVSYPDGPITVRYRFMFNAYWEPISEEFKNNLYKVAFLESVSFPLMNMSENSKCSEKTVVHSALFSKAFFFHAVQISVCAIDTTGMLTVDCLCALHHSAGCSRLPLSRSPRDCLKFFEISVPRHIRFAELRKKCI